MRMNRNGRRDTGRPQPREVLTVGSTREKYEVGFGSYERKQEAAVGCLDGCSAAAFLSSGRKHMDTISNEVWTVKAVEGITAFNNQTLLGLRLLTERREDDDSRTRLCRVDIPIQATPQIGSHAVVTVEVMTDSEWEAYESARLAEQAEADEAEVAAAIEADAAGS